MLKSLYVDNYRSLVNFKIEFNSLNLLLGKNGTGKTSVFDVLYNVRTLLINQSNVSIFFNTLTRWQTQPTQTIEFMLETEKGTYKYNLILEHVSDEKLGRQGSQSVRIKEETLLIDNRKLLEFREGTIQLYNGDGTLGTTYPSRSQNSAIATMPDRDDSLTYFKRQIANWIIIHPLPWYMSVREESSYPQVTVDNYVGWYRYLQQDGGFAKRLMDDLTEIIPEFDSFFLETVTKELSLRFKADGKKKIQYSLDELSDGQRMLIILYTLLNLPEHEDMKNVMIFIDEPDNFIALREVQPWISALYERCNDGEMQAILISHHPETINYLLMPSHEQVGYWFERSNLTPTRVERIATQSDQTGLPISELIARDWFHS